ncbi:MAG: hypothetical protein EAZ89_20860 [Bacteroidetes bacterium]|nr:MAG: hypothetical protein EAZ89_20860 [Bacteroidota bacterium]
MKIAAFFSLLLLTLALPAQPEAYSLPWLSEGWTLVSEDMTKEADLWQLSKADETATVQVYRRQQSVNLTQLMERVSGEIRPEVTEAKVTIVERHDGIDIELPYLIFLVEAKGYRPTGKPCSFMYLLVQGQEHTYVFCRRLAQARLPGGVKKARL